MIGILQNKLSKEYFVAKDYKRIGKLPYATNSLSLVHAPQGYGKSYAVASQLGQELEAEVVVYLDFDYNSRILQQHCYKRNIEYVNMTAGEDDSYVELYNVLKIIPKGAVVIVDSLASVFPANVDINNSASVATHMYKLSGMAVTSDLSIILIDHSTKQRDIKTGKTGFKIEGSESGKLKAVAMALSYSPKEIKNPEKGGIFTVEKSRLEGIRTGDSFSLGVQKTLEDAKKFIKGRGAITQTEFSVITKNSRDLWIRDFKLAMYTEHKDGNVTVLVPRTSKEVVVQTAYDRQQEEIAAYKEKYAKFINYTDKDVLYEMDGDDFVLINKDK